jgi:hypothetical protein
VVGLLLSGCMMVPGTQSHPLRSFEVTVTGIWVAGATRSPVPVVSRCIKQYGSQAAVPVAERGTPACPYAIPRGELEIDVAIVAMGNDGQVLEALDRPVSFRVVPGNLSGDYPFRWAPLIGGRGTGTVKVKHLYGPVRVWVEDGPPERLYVDGEPGGSLNTLPEEPSDRTFATGTSAPLYFDDPSIQRLQIPDGFDNRGSPFVGQFITVGHAPEQGPPLRQSCDEDPANDDKESMLIVTGTDPGGFFVTDLTACRLSEQLVDSTGRTQVRVPEPDGMLPGTYGSMYIYNYSYPEGLDEGDALWTIAGAVQEFSGTTQLVFPSWTVREKVRLLPETEWTKHLRQITPKELNLRICGMDDAPAPYITDIFCGHQSSNLKIESLESALVKVRRVRFSDAFSKCDLNGDGKVPQICDRRPDATGEARYWGDCNFDGTSTLSALEEQELACSIDCITGQGAFAGESGAEQSGRVCTERTTFLTFGQFVIELPGPGPAEAGLDATLPQRFEKVALGATSARSARAYGPGIQVRVWCDAPARVGFGDDQLVASSADAHLPANTLLEHWFTDGQTHVAVVASGTAVGGATCAVAQNTRTRMQVVTKDSIPELEPDCNPAHPDPARAAECVAFRAARYDVVGHLRQVQAARPRWVLIPRDLNDVCCHPGEGRSCPKPIKACP